MMTPAEKAVETRKRNSEARKQKDREKVEILHDLTKGR